jgi:hypothetical protein
MSTPLVIPIALIVAINLRVIASGVLALIGGGAPSPDPARAR